MNASEGTKKVVINLLPSLPLFTVAGLGLLVMKLSAYPNISWWAIIGIGLFPLLIVLAIISLVLALIVLGILGGLLFWGIIWLVSKCKRKPTREEIKNRIESHFRSLYP